MNSTLILFKEIGRQLLIVGLVLGSLPIAIRILWKLRLLPLGCYFVATKLFWPRWALAHRTACILIFIACVLFFVLCWTIRYIRQKREEQIMAELIHHYTKDPTWDAISFYAPSISCTSLSEPLTRPVSTSILNMSCPMYCQTIVTAGRDSSSAVLPPDRNAE